MRIGRSLVNFVAIFSSLLTLAFAAIGLALLRLEPEGLVTQPTRMEFACLKNFFDDQAVWTWWVEREYDDYYELVGGKMFGKWSPWKVMFILPKSTYVIPPDAYDPAVGLMFMRITTVDSKFPRCE